MAGRHVAALLIVATAFACSGEDQPDEEPVRAGQRYRALVDMPVTAMTHWRAPFTGGHDATLPAGEVFTVALDPPRTATAVSCDPERYDELHAHFVPAEDREAESYSNYSLTIDIDLISRSAELLSGQEQER